MNTVLDFLAVAGVVWLVFTVAATALLLWLATRNEPDLDEGEGEVLHVDFTDRGRAA